MGVPCWEDGSDTWQIELGDMLKHPMKTLVKFNKWTKLLSQESEETWSNGLNGFGSYAGRLLPILDQSHQRR